MSLASLIADLRSKTNPTRAQMCEKFLQTHPGGYGEGDKCLGITVPELRSLAKKYWQSLNLQATEKLLQSPYHEERMTALFILTHHFEKSDKTKQSLIISLYLNNTYWINNRDLVDCSAHKILGSWLLEQPKDILYDLAQSSQLWERRISIVATWMLIRHGQTKYTFELAGILLDDKHDLMHKAVGWMLREAGKKDENALREFLDRHHQTMPRTMLRYSLEKFDKPSKDHYMGR